MKNWRVILFCTILVISSCDKEEPKSVPVVQTGTVTDIGSTQSTISGEVLSDGNNEVIERGFLFADSPLNPSGSKFPAGAGSGIFSKEFKNLQSGRTYYYQAYATNTVGTAFGEELTFMTDSEIPSISTSPPAIIMATSVLAGGNVTNDGGSTVTARGLVWNTSTNPTVDHNKTTNGTGLGQFESEITNLTPNTTYYVRAYASNSNGTSYGNEIVVTTLTGVVGFGALTVDEITENTARLTGVITDIAGTQVIEKGFVWSDEQNPTVQTNKMTVSGGMLNSYSVVISDLKPGVKYFAKAYAINDLGVFYSTEKEFNTLAPSFGEMEDIDGNTYKTVRIGEQWWMAENLRVTKYADGTAIPYASSSEEWYNLNRSPAYTFYNNDSEVERVHGKMYVDWTLEQCCICPSGWRLPTREEYLELIAFLGGELVAGESLKSSNGWLGELANGNNLSGFNGLPSGMRGSTGSFGGFGTQSGWWASGRYYLFLSSTNDRASVRINTGFDSANWGMSIRCIRD